MDNGIRCSKLAERVIFSTGPLHRIHHLTQIVQIYLVERADGVGGWLNIDIQNIIGTFNETPANGPTGFAAPSGDNNIFHLAFLRV